MCIRDSNGEEGVDDDGNGYIDDVYGYNFADNKGGAPVPDADFHGTHVAGTVAARNNNGIGVCGVAGGDGTPNSGVRIMSTGVFSGKRGQGGFAKAFVYAADNGAVISQNSWGNQAPGRTPGSYRDAIDYFIKYAGCDNDGNQLADSPMKGGVVIIASGNSNSEERYAPGEYGPAIAVLSLIHIYFGCLLYPHSFALRASNGGYDKSDLLAEVLTHRLSDECLVVRPF